MKAKFSTFALLKYINISCCISSDNNWCDNTQLVVSWSRIEILYVETLLTPKYKTSKRLKTILLQYDIILLYWVITKFSVRSVEATSFKVDQNEISVTRP
jgi:hypothetical protein